MNLLAGLMMLIACAQSHASETSAKIQKGDWEVNGFVRLKKVEYRPPLYFIATGQYFFADGFSAGLDTTGSLFGTNYDFQFGPIVTKYFLTSGEIAPYLSFSPANVITISNRKPVYYSQGRLGVKFFLTDSLALGPVFQHNYQWDRDSQDWSDIFVLFSLHI